MFAVPLRDKIPVALWPSFWWKLNSVTPVSDSDAEVIEGVMAIVMRRNTTETSDARDAKSLLMKKSRFPSVMNLRPLCSPRFSLIEQMDRTIHLVRGSWLGHGGSCPTCIHSSSRAHHHLGQPCGLLHRMDQT